LRFLHFLGHRLSELGVLVVLTVRSGERGPTHALLERLAADRRTTVVSPAPLSAQAVREVIEGGLGEPEDAFTEACRGATGGNPFLLGELVRTLAERGIAPMAAEAAGIERAGPEAVARNVLVRLERLGTPAKALAVAAAVLGNGAELHQAAAVADLPIAAGGDAADALSTAGLLADARPLRFVHPLVRAAIAGSLGAGAAAGRLQRHVIVGAEAVGQDRKPLRTGRHAAAGPHPPGLADRDLTEIEVDV